MLAGPMVPPAPGLFSITIGWPRCFSVALASARIPMSVKPPAGHGTISVTGRVGNCCACATPANNAKAEASKIAFFMEPSLFRGPGFSGYRCVPPCPMTAQAATETSCGVLADEDGTGRIFLGRSGEARPERRALDRRAQFHRAQAPEGDEERRARVLLSYRRRKAGRRHHRDHQGGLSGQDR